MEIHCRIKYPRKRGTGFVTVLLRDTEVCRRERWREMDLEIGNLLTMGHLMRKLLARQMGIRCEGWPRMKRWLHLEMALLRDLERCHCYHWVMLMGLEIDTQ